MSTTNPDAIPTTTTDTTISKLVATGTTADATADATEITGYTPTFSATTRTVLYVVCAILGGIGMALTIVSLVVPSPTWLTITTAVMAYLPSYVANAFGVAYNPLKLAGK